MRTRDIFFAIVVGFTLAYWLLEGLVKYTS